MSPATLKKYGLSWDDYHQLVLQQHGVCPICKLPMKEEQRVIDHQHHKNWRRIKPENRKALVRGVLHRRCNWRFVGNLVTLEIACNVADYLLDYKDRCASM